MGKKILLIEDDSLLIDMYMLVLEEEGFQVSVLTDGKRALKHDLTDVDLVLLDMRLPEVSGLEVLRSYRRSGYTKPIIIITNNPQINVNHAMALGATHFLVKSHTPLHSLVALLRQCLE